ncbi:hypothetical protein D6783_05250 [Candidatus Woesearchaeota archaeon]|nr:MAG: hypothetical protein D6783_05250 [Candidatus Woesearchaeota archaeon]
MKGGNEMKCEGCNTEISDKVASYSQQHFGKALCMKCQDIVRQDRAKQTTQEQPRTPPPEETVIDTPTNRNKKWNINPDFIVKIQGKEFITANGLLEIAEQQAGGIQKIEVVSLHTNPGNTIATVRVTMKDGRIFEDCGSANNDNLKPTMQKYAVEMAVTRARSRAIRFGLNVDYCSVEELDA